MLYTTPTPATKYTISLAAGVVQVVAALVSPVARRPTRAVGDSWELFCQPCSDRGFASKRTAGASSFTDATSRHIQSRLSAQSAVSAASSGQRQTDR